MDKTKKVLFLPENKVYDFGYYTEYGVVLYEEGERNMQDSFATKEKNIKFIDNGK